MTAGNPAVSHSCLDPEWPGTVSSGLSGDIGRREVVRDLGIRIATLSEGQLATCGFFATRLSFPARIRGAEQARSEGAGEMSPSQVICRGADPFRRKCL